MLQYFFIEYMVMMVDILTMKRVPQTRNFVVIFTIFLRFLLLLYRKNGNI